MQLPKNIGPVHFVGIGGIGMSAIAEALISLGYQVQGSDLSANANVKRLEEKGATCFTGHSADNVAGAGVLVVSSAIKTDNPELTSARVQNIPIVQRADMLAELMRMKASISIAGTHGKTTTTSLVSAILVGGGLDPTVINGGIINEFGSNAHVGSGEWIVAEADESDGSFLKLPTQIGVITNIDPEHLEHYGSFDGVRRAFRQFVDRIPFYGFALGCIDNTEVARLVLDIKGKQGLTHGRFLTYGQNEEADVHVFDVRRDRGTIIFSLRFSDHLKGGAKVMRDFHLPMPGVYNALNSAAALTIGHELGLSEEQMRQSLARFSGVKRRFTHIGQIKGVDVYDDYAHHPVEIKAVLQAAREVTSGQLIAIMQPHRYTRLQSLFKEFSSCFDLADLVVMAPVYEAGETEIPGFTHHQLAEAIAVNGTMVQVISGEKDIAKLFGDPARPGDLVIGLGAGNISTWMHNLPNKIELATPRQENSQKFA